MGNIRANFCTKHNCEHTGYTTMYCPKCVTEQEMKDVFNKHSTEATTGPLKVVYAKPEVRVWSYHGKILSHDGTVFGFFDEYTISYMGGQIKVFCPVKLSSSSWPVGTKVYFEAKRAAHALGPGYEITDYEATWP